MMFRRWFVAVTLLLSVVPIRTAPPGPQPAAVPGHEWRAIDNPNAGNCEVPWQWGLFKR